MGTAALKLGDDPAERRTWAVRNMQDLGKYPLVPQCSRQLPHGHTVWGVNPKVKSKKGDHAVAGRGWGGGRGTRGPRDVISQDNYFKDIRNLGYLGTWFVCKFLIITVGVSRTELVKKSSLLKSPSPNSKRQIIP